ncbi:hypothetical protein [Xanthovirga aplysinae]|uniref:hypothetical protein n=1 Tax=Xanthovirga aplysinae TaxID=2529853 RepID=UPI0012BC49E8|nr:hypothetical protein [Xanthovirga aplysinae]MTI33031.1 hypothetical protein [Xanthovirga aplysinae]
MSLKTKKRRRRDRDTADISSSNNSSSSSSPPLKKRKTSNRKKGDTDSSDHKDRRAKRAERLSTSGGRKRSDGISRTNRDRSNAIGDGSDRRAQIINRERSGGISQDNSQRQRSGAITSREDGRGPDRRDLRARPIDKANDGTELWDGKTAPTLSEAIVKDVLSKQKPKYDIGKGRMVYPTETAPGVIEYLPLEGEASDNEIKNGLYVAIVPERPLSEFVNEKLNRESFVVEGGTITAIAIDNLTTAFENESNLVLRSQKYLDTMAASTTSLRQKWEDE